MRRTPKTNSSGTCRVFSYSTKVFRICRLVNPDHTIEDIGGISLSGRREAMRVNKDSEGKLAAQRKNFRFLLDPPTGSFRINVDSLQIKGRIQLDEQKSLRLQLLPKTEVYGLGAFAGRKDRNEGQYRLRTTDTLFYKTKGESYSAFPFLFFRNEQQCFAIFINTTYPLDFQIDDNVNEGLEVQVSHYRPSHDNFEPTGLDLIVFTGSPADIFRSYAQLTGQPFLPPVWALGYHQSRWSYSSQDAVLHIAETARKHNLPIDAIHLDIDYMDRYRVFTWNHKRFPNPELLHSKLHEHGIRTVAIVDPGIATATDYSVYQEGLADDHFCRKPDGELYVGKVWPGRCVFPDFTQEATRYWWARNHKVIFNANVSGIWNDMNEPALKMGQTTEPLSEPITHADGTHLRYRNLYATLEAKATTEAFSVWKPNHRPFILTRSGFSGIQKYAALWTGDNHASWQHLRDNLYQVINLGLSGVPFAGADVGGFGSGPGTLGVIKLRRKPELFQRWVELGSLMPFFRIHTSKYSYSQDPWSYGDEILALTHKHISRRYSLLHYIYSLFWQAHRQGSPIVRPLFYEFADSSYEKTHLQFMLGPSLLAAPVLQPKITEQIVELPAGEWYEFETGDLFRGGCTVPFPVSPGYYPLFIRAGSVIPFARPGRNAFETLRNEIFVQVFPDNEVQGNLILDDGQSLDYHQDHIFEAYLKGKRDRNGDLALEWHIDKRGFIPAQSKMTLRLPPYYRMMTQKSKKIQGVSNTLSSDGRSAQVVEYELPLTQEWSATFIFRNIFSNEL